MPIERNGWMFGPRLGKYGTGTLVSHLDDGRLAEEWLSPFLPEDRAFRAGMKKLKPAAPPWVSYQVVDDEDDYLRVLLERVGGVSLRDLKDRLDLQRSPLPVEAACFIGAQLCEAFSGALPSDNPRVCPEGVQLAWDGKVRFGAWPLHEVPLLTYGVGRRFNARFLTAPSRVANIGALLTYACGDARLPAEVLRFFGRFPALKSSEPRVLGELKAALERTASNAWLARELRELFTVEYVTQQSHERHARREHPDLVPDQLLEQVNQASDDAAYAVLTDHLLSHDRPRGRLALLQQQRGPDWEHEQAVLLETWPELSPLQPRSEGVTLEWRAGWVVGITVSEESSWVSLFLLLDHPSSVFCQRLTVTATAETCEEALRAVECWEQWPLKRLELAYAVSEARERLRASRPAIEVVQVAPAPPRPEPAPEPEPPPGALARLRNVLLRRPR